MKKRLYPRAGFPTFWLINLLDNQIEVYTQPSGPIGEPGYLHRQDFGPDNRIPLVIVGREIGQIAVRDLLPWKKSQARGDRPEPGLGSTFNLKSQIRNLLDFKSNPCYCRN